MQNTLIKLTLVAIVVLLLCPLAFSETFRKRYVFDYSSASRRASSMRAQAAARKMLLRDFLQEKFSKEIVENLKEEIETALDPADNYLSDFKVVSERPNEAETQVTLTVEAEVDLPGMISALVQNKVLSFGEAPPKIMILPSSRFTSEKAAKNIRALIYDKLKQSGLSPVAYEGIRESISIQTRAGAGPSQEDRRTLIRTAVQYGADYLVYIDTEAEPKPFSGGGFICDTNFNYTILRPNANLILGESLISARGSGSSAMLAFDRALEEATPKLVPTIIGQLYQSIYSDSDVIYTRPQLRESLTVKVHEGSSAQVQAIINALQSAGARVTLGMSSGPISNLSVETSMDDLELYNHFNGQTLSAGAEQFKTPVVAYAENVIEVEAVKLKAEPKRPAALTPPAPGVRKNTSAAQSGSGEGRVNRPSSGGPTALSSAAATPKVIFKLRPAKFNQ